jgi:hypothetical protein
MKKTLRGKLTYANLVSTLCLFLLLGGGAAFAAEKLASNSVGTAQLKNGAVTAAKVKSGSLLATDFKSGQLPAGERGPQGLPGAAGLNGAPGLNGAATETEVRNASTPFNNTTPKEMTVECPNGPVLGGGYVIHGAAPAESAALRALRSYPVAANTWLVRATDDSGAHEWELTVSAVCAK